MNPRRLLSVLSLAAALFVTAATPAAASCGGGGGSFRQRMKGASTVFVGAVDSAGESGLNANVVVESVWKGQVNERVQVHGGDPSSPSATRNYDVGVRYAFFPLRGSGRFFEDGLCSSARRWNPHLDRHRPEGATTVSGPPVAQAEASTEDAVGTPLERQPQPADSSRGWLSVARSWRSR